MVINMLGFVVCLLFLFVVCSNSNLIDVAFIILRNNFSSFAGSFAGSSICSKKTGVLTRV